MESRRYQELDVIRVPEDVPEAGIRAGDEGAIVDIAPDGTLTVDVVEPETGRTLDMLFVEPGPPLRVVGRWRVNG
jgi:hypothetical protein